jgi:hypothetical protein
VGRQSKTPRIIYKSYLAAAPEEERTVLAAVYRLIIDLHLSKQATGTSGGTDSAKGEPENGPRTGGRIPQQ